LPILAACSKKIAKLRSTLITSDKSSAKLETAADDLRKTSGQANRLSSTWTALIAEDRPDIHKAAGACGQTLIRFRI